MRHRDFDYSAIRAAYKRLGSPGRVAEEMRCSLPTVRRALRGRDKAVTLTSSPGGTGNKGRGVVLDERHGAAVEGVPLFPTMVRPIGKAAVFKAGEFSSKIGGVVLKGHWRGFPIFTLTLQERATCPRSCHHWLSCYGNNSPYSIRLRHGPELEKRIVGEISDMAVLHRQGFAVRLHNLGDFYSVPYVEMWRDLLARHPALHCFGYTARRENDPIGEALRVLIDEQWPRFAIRFSDGESAPSTVSILDPSDKPEDAVICPEQMGQAESCSTCALCWQTRKRIAFVRH